MVGWNWVGDMREVSSRAFVFADGNSSKAGVGRGALETMERNGLISVMHVPFKLSANARALNTDRISRISTSNGRGIQLD
jgi:hypothetical protein